MLSVPNEPGESLGDRDDGRVYQRFVDTPLIPDPDPENWGHWGPTVQLMRRLGAAKVQALGAGLGVTFAQFAVETQVYPTRAVVAMGAREFFRLSDEVKEPRAFSVQLSRNPYTGGYAPEGAIDIGFAPMPDRTDGVDGVELARRYVVVLSSLLAKHPRLFGSVPDLPHAQRWALPGPKV